MVMLVPLTKDRVAIHAAIDGAGKLPQHAAAGTATPLPSASENACGPLNNTVNDTTTTTISTSSSSPWAPAAVEARLQRFLGLFSELPAWILDAVTVTKVLSENEELRRPASE
jgi:hypothetical protein